MSQLLQQREGQRTEMELRKKRCYHFSHWIKHQNSNEMKCNSVKRGMFSAYKGVLIVALCFYLSPVPGKPNASLCDSF